MFDPSMDGIDHINAYSQSKTELGRLLSNFPETPFIHPQDGPFSSIEGYWYFLLTGSPEFRKLSGFEAKSLGKKLRDENPALSYPVGFEDKIKIAIREKINSHPNIAEMLKKSELPIVHYYVRKDENSKEYAVEVKKHSWLWEEYSMIRASLRGEEYIPKDPDPNDATQFSLF